MEEKEKETQKQQGQDEASLFFPTHFFRIPSFERVYPSFGFLEISAPELSYAALVHSADSAKGTIK
jgi:hypothetical protein